LEGSGGDSALGESPDEICRRCAEKETRAPAGSSAGVAAAPGRVDRRCAAVVMV
jgi:hypothetical protein